MYTAANGAWFSHALENFPTTYWNKEIQKRKCLQKKSLHYITRTRSPQNDHFSLYKISRTHKCQKSHPLSNIFHLVLMGSFQKPPFTKVGKVSPFGLVQLASLSTYKSSFLQGFNPLIGKSLSDPLVLSYVYNARIGNICYVWLIAGVQKSPYNLISQLTIWPRGNIWAE